MAIDLAAVAAKMQALIEYVLLNLYLYLYLSAMIILPLHPSTHSNHHPPGKMTTETWEAKKINQKQQSIRSPPRQPAPNPQPNHLLHLRLHPQHLQPAQSHRRRQVRRRRRSRQRGRHRSGRAQQFFQRSHQRYQR